MTTSRHARTEIVSAIEPLKAVTPLAPCPTGLVRIARTSSITLLVVFGLSCTTTLYKRPWIQVETPHFRIASTIGEHETVALVKQLELFRTVVQSITNITAVDSAVPTKFFIFERKYDFKHFMKRDNVVGYFQSGMRANYIMMREDRVADEAAVIRHEYVHFLMNNATQTLFPKWYSEGFAEFLSTVTIHKDGKHVIIGAFPSDRRRGFRWGSPAPFEEIISARPGSKINGNMFYEQSWALVHWIQLGRGPDHSPDQEMARYLELILAGHPNVEAFEEAFGVEIEDVGIQLSIYLNGNYEAVAVPLDFFKHQAIEPSVTTMTQEEVSVALGQLALVRDNARLARDLFESAIAINPANPRAHAGLGDALTLRGDWGQAESHFVRAIELDPQDAECELDYAKYLHRMALRDDIEIKNPQLLSEARRHYVRSYKLDAGIPETYAMYGKSFLISGEDSARGIETLEHAYSLLPANREILYLLAKAYVMSDRKDDARPLVERIVASMHEGDRAVGVDELMAELAQVTDF